MSIVRNLLATAFCTFALSSASLAAAVNFALVDLENSFDASSNTLGWRFEVNQSLTVTSLGQMDLTLDGLDASADIAIFDLNGNVLVSGSVGSGTTGEMDEGFRYADVTPTALLAGQQYVIASYMGDGEALDVFPLDETVYTVDPAITLIVDRYEESSSLEFPTIEYGEPGWFGPNFRFELTDTIPEPASALLLGVGLAAIGFGRYRGQRKAA